MEPEIPEECCNCGQQSLFQADAVAAGGQGPNYLPGLGKFLAPAKFTVIVCENCGLTRFFTHPAALKKLNTSAKWKRL